MNDIISMRRKKESLIFLFAFYCDCCYYYCIFFLCRCLSLCSRSMNVKNRLLSTTARFVCLFNFDVRWRQILNPNRASMILIRNDHFGAPIETIGLDIQEENEWKKEKETNPKEHTQTLINSHLQLLLFLFTLGVHSPLLVAKQTDAHRERQCDVR